jgi:hypothetical protein
VHFFVSAVTVYGQSVVFVLCHWSLFWYVPCLGLYLNSTIEWNIRTEILHYAHIHSVYGEGNKHCDSGDVRKLITSAEWLI